MYQKLFIYISSCLDFSLLLIAFVPFLEKPRFFSGIFFHGKQDCLHGVSVTKPPVQESFLKRLALVIQKHGRLPFPKNKSELLEFHSKFPKRIRSKTFKLYILSCNIRIL